MNNFFIVIPTRDRLDFLCNLLKDLNYFTPYISQVLIVDQSVDSMDEPLAGLNLGFKYTLVKNSRSSSVNHSRNLALDYYKDEEFLFFMDDDLRISKSVFDGIVSFLNK
ncbi:MAG: glycosyltransferase family 2 protein, partial [Ignavibacteriae bacterium]|nr:glycosyltransferase family 2 protein [Ignavibacteriota bacterium]